MPADFSALFDSLLVIAGLTLVIVGVVMFIYSKTASAASSVEAFGIKLNVTHPSLILVLAGVGLMLAPRLLPDSARDEKDKSPAVVAEAPSEALPKAPAEAAPAAAGAIAPRSSEHDVPATSTAARPMAAHPEPTSSAPASATAPAAPISKASPAVTQASRPKPAHPKPVSPKPVTPAPSAGASSKPPAGQPAPDLPSPAPATPSPASQDAKPARTVIAYAALGLPIARTFWDGETQPGYTRRMNTALATTGRSVLRMDARSLDFGPSAFDAWWNESNAHPKSRSLCEGVRALLAARVETPNSYSSVESAYWPELRLRLYDCATHRVYRQQKTLAPHKDDAWPFSVELGDEVERFLRTYRADLND